MQRVNIKKYIYLGLILVALVTIPPLAIEKMRSSVISLFSPLWKGSTALMGRSIAKNKLETENHLLQLEVKRLKKMLQTSQNVVSSVPATVIYRDPLSWTSFLWIDVGEEWNQRNKCKIIKKNSPVIYGKAIVGVVDFVGKRHSKVRLITDLGCKPSVRVARGQAQKEELCNNSKEWYLAKGVLEGSSRPLWNSKEITLKGIGFTYDVEEKVPLIQVNDLLVTTGMDGVFPAGLHAARVTKVMPLKNGAYSYDIVAKPIIQNLNDIETVFVIQGLDFEEER